MSLIARYHPPQQELWQGRNDLPDEACFFQKMRFLNLLNPINPNPIPTFALLGFQCDEGIKRNFGRVGASEGPVAIRKALAKIPISHEISCTDAGDIICNDDNLEAAQYALAQAAKRLIQANYIPIVLGGGHELAWGHFQGISDCFPIESLGILNFDAHFDMRPITANQGSSGTPFLQMAEFYESQQKKINYHCIGIQPSGNIALLFENAKKYQVDYVLAEDVYLKPKIVESFIANIIKQHQFIYVSVCLDVFASFAAPGVSAPQPLGVTPWQIIPALRQLAASGKVIAIDFAEMSPRYDIDNRTAKLAAVLIYEILRHYRGDANEKQSS